MKAIGIDVGGQTIKGAVVDENGKISHESRVVTPKTSGIDVITAIADLVKEIQNKSEEKLPIGIAVAGMLNKDSRVMLTAPQIVGWKNFPLADELEKQIESKIFILNDANAAAFGEFIFGQGKGSEKFLSITLGTGVGGGIILDDKLFTGAFGSGGEVGHVSIDLNGKKCNCGGVGCVETYLGAAYLAQEVEEEIANYDGKTTLSNFTEPVNYHHLTQEVRNGDELANKIWNKKMKILGHFLASVNNLIDLDTIVLAGGITQSKDLMLEPVKINFDKYSPFIRQTNILATNFSNEAGILGAAAFALKN
ncbi:MAG: ROK family protein [Calditrichaeota bacterium]|nr:MAG: ROK family protein [Calditrichota bacterium]